MENLWEKKGRQNQNADSDPMGLSDFNCVPVELTHEDLNNLEQDVMDGELPSTAGFFFGSDSDEYYQRQDLEFIKKAREALDAGLTVVYDSWW